MVPVGREHDTGIMRVVMYDNKWLWSVGGDGSKWWA